MCASKAHVGVARSVPVSVPERGPMPIIRQHGSQIRTQKQAKNLAMSGLFLQFRQP